MLEIENQHLFDAALRSGLNLFLGAGFSVLARNAAGTLPVGNKLAPLLLEEFALPSHMKTARLFNADG